MKSPAADWDLVPAPLQTLYAPVRAEMEQVEAILLGRLRSDFPFVDQLAGHGFRLGGKRLRPALLLLSAKSAGRIAPEHLDLAAVVELIHTATLIHDDVLDEATLRRHLDTVNARWDNEASVLLGDYLLAQAFCMAAAVEDPLACRALAEASRVTCEGELRQIECRGDYSLAEAEYLDIITAKTAALTGCACRLGAHYAGAEPRTVELLADYGRDLGIAFQIADDLLDLLGEEAKVGKSLGTDLQKQKPTLPLIRVLLQAAPAERARLIGELNASGSQPRALLAEWFGRYDAISYARETARRFARRAADRLDLLPPSPGRDALRGLADFVVERQQ
jgi:octaprenyl-diphosphate synthase